MLCKLNEWCTQWKIEINAGKSQVLHFRRKYKKRSEHCFSVGSKVLNYESSYKYLGVWVNEFCEFSKTEKLLSESAGRALGKIIGKFKGMRNMGYNTYTKLYNSCVSTILNYGVGVWGAYTNGQISEKIQNRACRVFLGVHKYSANVAINGDMGWNNHRNRQKLDMIRLWNRIITMDNERITQIFLIGNMTLA